MRVKDAHDAPQLPACIRKKKWDSCNIPGIFTDRILKLGILSFSILFLGSFMGIQMESPGFIFWSVVLGVEIFVQALWLLHTARTGGYEVVEGMVLEITARSPFKKFQKIKIGFADGAETDLLLEKNIHMEQGSRYRFYFRRRQDVLSGIKAVDAALSTGSFYGLEEIGKGRGDGKM